MSRGSTGKKKQVKASKRHLTAGERVHVAYEYEKHFNNETGLLKKGKMKIIQNLIPDRPITRNAVYKIVNESKAQLASGNNEINLASKPHGGQNKMLTPHVKHCYDEIYNADRFISADKIPQVLGTEYGIEIRRTTGYELVKEYCNKHREHLKPLLTELHTIQRLKYVCDDVDTINQKFYNFNNTIHADEKKFVMIKDGKLYHWPKHLPLPPEDVCAHTGYIGWVMILLVVAQPRKFRHNGKLIDFDGKIGTYAFTKDDIWVNGVRHAKEVVDGKIESAMTFCECLERYVYSDIKKKLFWLKNNLTWFVIDGATCHTAFRIHDNPSVYDRISKFGATGEIRVVRNAPRSPGMMILDLGLNRSLESQVLHEPMVPDAIALVKLVSKKFWEYDSDKLLVMWGVLAEVYRQVLANKGGNANAPHSHVR
jgi:hypothetical protein